MPATLRSMTAYVAQGLYKGDRDEIFFANINARSFYFCDAAHNILEFIVHYALDQETEGAFGPADILHVSEIGLPVEDVPAQAGLLQKAPGIQPYRGQVSDDFAFLGDIYGQLVVVRTGRPWLPTETVLAAPAPVQLTVIAIRPGSSARRAGAQPDRPARSAIPSPAHGAAQVPDHLIPTHPAEHHPIIDSMVVTKQNVGAYFEHTTTKDDLQAHRT